MKKQSVVILASYGGPYFGNFIPSLIAFDEAVKSMGYRTVYVFPEFTEKCEWASAMRGLADEVYYIPYHPYSWDNIKRIRTICKQENAEIMYSRMSGWDITARMAMPRLPLVWHMEMGLNLRNIKEFIKYWIKYRILGFGKTYHAAVSEPVTESINSLGVKNQCVWIPNAIDLSRLKQKEEKTFHNPIKLLTFAYQPFIKGYDLALDACEILNAEGVKVLLMASAQENTYQYTSERYGTCLPEWLQLMEPTDNIAQLYCSADIMLSPSRSEGFSYCLAEALYAGLPIVYSDVPGTRWADEMKIGYRFPSGDASELANQILECIKYGIRASDQKHNRMIIEKKYLMDEWQRAVHNFMMEIVRKDMTGR